MKGCVLIDVNALWRPNAGVVCSQHTTFLQCVLANYMYMYKHTTVYMWVYYMYVHVIDTCTCMHMHAVTCIYIPYRLLVITVSGFIFDL